MKIKSFVFLLPLLSGSAMAGWGPVQTLETSVNVDDASTRFVALGDLQWGEKGEVSLNSGALKFLQLTQLKRSKLSDGAWVSQALVSGEWVSSPLMASKGDTFWVQRSTSFDTSAGSEHLMSASYRNAIWSTVDVHEETTGQILPSELLSAEKLSDGRFLVSWATLSPGDSAQWSITGARVGADGVMLASSSLDVPGLVVRHNQADIYAVNAGIVTVHKLAAAGNAWELATAYTGSSADLQILDIKKNVAVLAENYNRSLRFCHVKSDASLNCGAAVAMPANWSVSAATVEAVSADNAVVSFTQVNSLDASQAKVNLAHLNAKNKVVMGPQLAADSAFNVTADSADHFAVTWVAANNSLRLARWDSAWQKTVTVAADAINAKSCFAGATAVLAWVNKSNILVSQAIKTGSKPEQVSAGWSRVLDCVAASSGTVQVAGLSSAKALQVAAYSPTTTPSTPENPDDPSRGSDDNAASDGGGGGGSLGWAALGLLLASVYRKTAR